MSDNYISPYGFGPITDAVLDAIADRRDLTTDKLVVLLERLPEEVTEELGRRIDDDWWRYAMGPAVDRLEDILSEYIAFPGDDR